jgi:mRNA interferase HigB
MHIITRKRLNEFAAKYPETNNALAVWYRQMKQNKFACGLHVAVDCPESFSFGM